MFRRHTPNDATDLIGKLLVYNPERRLKPLDALCHPFFDDLRKKETRLPNGNPLPDLFAFQKEEISSTSPEIMQKLIPEWYVPKEAEVREQPQMQGDPDMH